MNVTGLTKRSLAERDAITFLFFGSLSNVTGSGVFGFSGDGGSDRFLFKEGKIYDPENRYFLLTRLARISQFLEIYLGLNIIITIIKNQ